LVSFSIVPAEARQSDKGDDEDTPGELQVLYEADFATIPDELLLVDIDGNDVSGKQVSTDDGVALRLESTDGRFLFFTTDVAAWTDYALEAQIRIESGGLTLAGRVGDDLCTGYTFFIFPADNYAELGQPDKACDTIVLDFVERGTVQTGEWMTLRLEMIGDQISGAVDGVPLLSVSDAEFDTGGPAIFFYPGLDKAMRIDIASVRVEGMAAPNLTAFNETPQDAVEELSQLGLVPTNVPAQLVFVEDRAWFNGAGSWYTPLARGAPRVNVAMAGTINFTPGSTSEYEVCTLMARVQSEGNSSTAELNVGFDNENRAVLFDRTEGGIVSDRSSAPVFDSGIDYHLMFILVEDRANVYIDGERIFADVPIEVRSGSFGIGLIGAGPNASCQGRRVWVYSFD
jgi:hypothetical protein